MVNNLSEREKQLVRLICQELTSKEIAFEMGIKKRTVERHKENIRFKLDIKSNVGLALYGVKTGIHKL